MSSHRHPAFALASWLVPLGMASVARADTLTIGPYLLDPRPDGVVVAWEAEPAAAGSVVVDTPAGPRRFLAGTQTHHAVRVDGLAAGRYRYRILDSHQAVLAASTLATAATGGDFTFLVYGDTRDVEADHAQIVAAAVREQPDFVLHLGDMVRGGADERLWRDFFRVEAPLLATTPVYAAVGNHELLGDRDATHFLRFFPALSPAGGTTAARQPVPAPGPSPDRAGEPTWYEFLYGGSLFVALDGNRADSAAQTAWLAGTLERGDGEPAIKHVFVFVHQPPLSNGIFCGLAAAKQQWLPELERHRVSAVFAGHEHHYERLQREGVHYFVTGGGGAPLIGARPGCGGIDASALERFEVAHHFLRVRVRGTGVSIEAITPHGTVIDQVMLRDPRPRPPVSRDEAGPGPANGPRRVATAPGKVS